MSWRVISGPTPRKVTQSLADVFNNMNPAPHDRPLRNDRVQHLKAEIIGGRFRTAEWASVKCKEDGHTYRVNGKHTSHVFSQLNGETPRGTTIIVTEFECDKLEDVAALYSTFDTRSSVRSSGDINRIYGAVAGLDVAARIINRCVTGMSFAIWENGYARHKADERAQLLIAHKDFVEWAIQFQDTVRCRHLQRGPVIAAMFQTYRKNKSAAAEFWTAVRDGSGARPSVPDRKLERYLLSTSVNTGAGARGRDAASQREVYVKCLHAWNAWRSGTDTDLKFYPKVKTPSPK